MELIFFVKISYTGFLPYSVFKFILQSCKDYIGKSIVYSYTIHSGIFELRDLLNTGTISLMYKSRNIMRVRKWW